METVTDLVHIVIRNIGLKRRGYVAFLLLLSFLSVIFIHSNLYSNKDLLSGKESNQLVYDTKRDVYGVNNVDSRAVKISSGAKSMDDTRKLQSVIRHQQPEVEIKMDDEFERNQNEGRLMAFQNREGMFLNREEEYVLESNRKSRDRDQNIEHFLEHDVQQNANDDKKNENVLQDDVNRNGDDDKENDNAWQKENLEGELQNMEKDINEDEIVGPPIANILHEDIIKQKEGIGDDEVVNDVDINLNRGLDAADIIDEGIKDPNKKSYDSEKEEEALIHKLSQLLEELEKEGLDTDLEKKLFRTADELDDQSGYFNHLYYPQEMNFTRLFDEYRKTGHLPGNQINPWGYRPIINPSTKCLNTGRNKTRVFVLFVVKTSPDHFDKRKVLRETWADEKRFPNIRVVFSIGLPSTSNTMMKLKVESLEYGDILMMDYKDTYYNLTLKTTSGINWAVQYCNMAEYMVSVDDDMYVATDQLFDYLEGLRPDRKQRLYSGYVYSNTKPVRRARSRDLMKKWIISKQEYPFDTYPNYVFGGFIIMSMRTVIEMSIAIPYTKFLKFEDAYLGIVASRLGIVPVDTKRVDAYITYSNSEKFKTLIASHNYKSSKTLRKAWECHLSFVENNIEKSVYCLHFKKELEALREQIDYLMHWVDNYDKAI